MMNIKIICVGRLKEKFYIDGAAEYLRRLSAYCKAEVEELPETKRSASPSPAETETALRKEADAILNRIPKGATVIAMCIEGKMMDSPELAGTIKTFADSGCSRLCFLIGGSDGLHDSVKKAASLRLSMSKMTFPHHLARVMLLEQLYRSFKIIEGSHYHK